MSLHSHYAWHIPDMYMVAHIAILIVKTFSILNFFKVLSVTYYTLKIY